MEDLTKKGLLATDAANPLVGIGASALGGLLSARAERKAQERQIQLQKQQNRVGIEQAKAGVQTSLLQNLAANLASTLTGI